MFSSKFEIHFCFIYTTTRELVLSLVWDVKVFREINGSRDKDNLGARDGAAGRRVILSCKAWPLSADSATSCG